MRIIVALTVLLLAACGFQPLYGGIAGPITATGQIAIEPIADRPGQILRNLLIDRLYRDGRPTEPTHRLTITLRTNEQERAIQKDATASRARLQIFASLSLRDQRGREVMERELRSIADYNILDETFATDISREDARERALTNLADQIAQLLAVSFRP